MRSGVFAENGLVMRSGVFGENWLVNVGLGGGFDCFHLLLKTKNEAII